MGETCNRVRVVQWHGIHVEQTGVVPMPPSSFCCLQYGNPGTSLYRKLVSQVSHEIHKEWLVCKTNCK